MTTTPVTGSFHDLARTEARKSTAMATAMAAKIGEPVGQVVADREDRVVGEHDVLLVEPVVDGNLSDEDLARGDVIRVLCYAADIGAGEILMSVNYVECPYFERLGR